MTVKFSKGGFTLVEVLVVVAIISILASVFLVGLRGFRGGAYDSRRLGDLQKVQSYLEIYYNKDRRYPSSSTWSELSSAITTAGIGVTSIPNDPISSQTYYYGVSSDRQSYVLGAKISDPDSSLLKESGDADGTVYGVYCGDDQAIYCVQS